MAFRVPATSAQRPARPSGQVRPGQDQRPARPSGQVRPGQDRPGQVECRGQSIKSDDFIGPTRQIGRLFYVFYRGVGIKRIRG